MKAIILAAGRGSRMKDATEARPKCLTPFAGRPLLEWQIEALRGAGLDEIAVVTGYRAGLLEPYPVIRFHNPDWAGTNMVLSLACAAEWLRADECIVSYSDIVYSADAVRRLGAAEGDIALTYDPDWLRIWSARFADPLVDAESFRIDRATGRLREIGRRCDNLADIEGQYMGLLRFTPAGWATVEAYLNGLAPEVRRRLDMTTLLGGLLAAGQAIGTAAIADRWYEVDSQRDLALYESWMAAAADPFDPDAAGAPR